MRPWKKNKKNKKKQKLATTDGVIRRKHLLPAICRMLIRMESQFLKISTQNFLCHNLSSFVSSNKASEEIPTSRSNVRAHVYQEAETIINISTAQLSKHLLRHILYNKDGVVALNKPYGLASSREKTNIYDCLPMLAKSLGHEDLKVVSIPERYTSGITLLAASSSVEKEIDKSMRRTRSLAPETSKIYLSVTIGNPVTEESCQKYAITKQRKGNRDYELILRDWANRARKRQEVNVGLIGHKLVSSSEYASLVSVGTWLYQHHCPRVFLSDVLLSPVLGDTKFSPRVGTLFEKTIFIKPWNAPPSKYLSDQLLLSLHLYRGEERFIPIHHHLYELQLKKLFNRNLDLIIQAKPPAHFCWTCQQLGLTIPSLKPSGLVVDKESGKEAKAVQDHH